MDTEGYENQAFCVGNIEAIADTRAVFQLAKDDAHLQEEPTPQEVEKRRQALDELVAETERLGLYK